jgi:capsular exopolysaccharide synthesis family protein
MTTPTYPNGYQEPLDPQLDDDSFIFRRYLSLFVSNWYWFAISLFTALTIVYCINRYSEKIFTVSSSLLIKDEKGGGLSFGKNIMPGSDVFNSQQNLNNEIGILKSFSLNKRVMDSLPEFKIVYFGVGKRNIVESRLYKGSPFLVKTEAINRQPQNVKIYVTIISATTYRLETIGKNKITENKKFGERFSDYGFNFIISLRDPEHFAFRLEESNKYYFSFAGSEDLASYYLGNLDVTPVSKDATLVNLSSSGFVPEQEVDYLNKLMELYIWEGLESKNQTADSTIKFIDRQIKTISDSLINAENNLQNFRLENKLVNINEEGTFLQIQIEKLDNEKTILELQYQYYQYLKKYLDSRNESGDIVSPSAMGVTDQALGRLVLELAVLQQKKKQLSMNLSEELPPVNLSEENIIIAKKALSENVESGLFNLEQSLADVNKRIDKGNQEIKKLPGTERDMISIKRKFDLNNTVYTYLLEKRAETGIARASNVSDNKIIDEAEIYNSSQIKPRPRSNDLKAFIIGLFVPGLIITLLYYFNNRIIDNGDILKRTSVPIVGYVSHNDDVNEIPVIDSPRSALSESFRSIRTTLRYFIKETSHPVMAITSTVSSEGKTFISINLAAVTALLGKKVLLIGLDLRKPRIHRIIGIDNSEGLSTYLSCNCEYDDVIKETSISNLYYASSGPVPPNPAELIDDERMSIFIEKAKKDFDYIFIDTPPIAVVSDTLLISRFVDINLFVVRQRFSSKNTLELIQELYKGEKLKNMGIIINDISLSGYYGYGLRYGYYRGYGYAYGKNYYGQYSYYRYGYSEEEHKYYNS